MLELPKAQQKVTEHREQKIKLRSKEKNALQQAKKEEQKFIDSLKRKTWHNSNEKIMFDGQPVIEKKNLPHNSDKKSSMRTCP